MRSTAQVTSPTGLHPGDHLCWSYASDEEYRRGLVEYLAAGVDAGDKLLCFGIDVPVDAVLADLDALIRDDVESLTASGRLGFADARAAYTPDGRFDPARMLDAFRGAAAQARSEGYRALRAAGETAWLYDFVPVHEITTYEGAAERMASAAPLVALCTYDARGCDASALAEVHAVHPASYGQSKSAPRFRVYAAPDGGVAVHGEVDAFSSATLRAALAAALAAAERPYVIDLAGLAFADGAALRAMASVLIATAADDTAELRGMPALAQRCWDLLDLAQVAPHVRIA